MALHRVGVSMPFRASSVSLGIIGSLASFHGPAAAAFSYLVPGPLPRLWVFGCPIQGTSASGILSRLACRQSDGSAANTVFPASVYSKTVVPFCFVQGSARFRR